MYMDYDSSKYKKIISEKDIEIKDFQKKTKLLISQISEKNKKIEHLEKLLKRLNNPNYNNLSNYYFLLDSNEDPFLNANNNNFYYPKNELDIKSNEIYKTLYKNYEKLRKENIDLKKEND